MLLGEAQIIQANTINEECFCLKCLDVERSSNYLREYNIFMLCISGHDNVSAL